MTPEVLHDWLPRRLNYMQGVPDDEAELVRQGTLAKLRVQMAEEATEADARLASQLDKHVAAVEKSRKANKAWVISLDNALRAGIGRGLQAFIPRKRCRALLEGESRYLADFTPPGESQPRKRACLLAPDGSRSWEMPLKVEAGRKIAPALHLSLDQEIGRAHV